jgi:hypothetical protein
VNRRIRLLPAALCLVTASCAPRLVTLPSGAGSAFPDYARTYELATERCRGVRSMAAVLAISGRAGGHRLRAKLDAGFEAPARVRLEFPAPGKPIFVYVAIGEDATLVLPREGRVLRGASPAATLEALAGVAIDPEDLRTIVAGCGFATGAATAGRAFDRVWVAVDSGGATSWLQQVNGAWQMTASVRGAVEVRYADFQVGRPATIRLRASPGRGDGKDAPLTDLTIRLSQVDINEPLGADAFRVEVAPDATPMTLEQLREAGPLGR